FTLGLVQFTTTPAMHAFSLPDALPISRACDSSRRSPGDFSSAAMGREIGRASGVSRHADAVAGDGDPLLDRGRRGGVPRRRAQVDRKSTRLNSSHVKISYAVFCLKKKK